MKYKIQIIVCIIILALGSSYIISDMVKGSPPNPKLIELCDEMNEKTNSSDFMIITLRGPLECWNYNTNQYYITSKELVLVEVK